MNCKSCKKEIPQGRVDLGYKVCVDCSEVERYGCVDIVYHKTGNTIQIMPQEDAAKINKLSQRTGFGTLRGLKSGSAPKYKTKIDKGCSLTRVGSEANYNKVGEKCMLWVELEDWDRVDSTLEKAKKDFEISSLQYQKLKRIMKEFMPKVETNLKINIEHKKIDDEIEKQFRHWRNSKIYK
jgi:hypothetical protein